MSNSFGIVLAIPIVIVGKLPQQNQQQWQQLKNHLSNSNSNSAKKGNSSFNTIAHVCILLPIHWLNRQSWEITSAVTIKYYTALERQFSKKTIAGQHLHLIGVQILKDKKEKWKFQKCSTFFFFSIHICTPIKCRCYPAMVFFKKNPAF